MDRYEEALERAKNHLNNDGLTLEQYNTIYTIFPELESKDERTRKKIIAFLEELQKLGKNINFDKWKTSDCAEWIIWLENQSKKSQGKTALEAVKEENVNNQNCVKSTDNVKPKFRKDDWAVSNLDRKARQISEVHFDKHNSYYVVDGKSVNLEEYDRLHHLWSIEDAKDGDVLIANIHHWEIGGNIENFPIRVPTIFIYRDVKTDNKNIHAYVSLFNNTTLDIYKSMYYIDDYGIKDIHPTTEKQKELLFNKIREAKWYWNAETKELSQLKETKINNSKTNKHVNWELTDEQINTLEHFIRSLGESGHLSPYDKNTKIIYSLLKDLKNLTKTNRYISWNDYDKDMIKALILIFEANKDAYWKIEGKHNDVVKADEIIAWLESLKDND